VRGEWDELIAEMKSDPNKGHFKRTDWDESTRRLAGRLAQGVRRLPGQLADRRVFRLRSLQGDEEARQQPGHVRSCSLMSRDESRHAGFINDALKDAGIGVNLGFLTKAKKYTFFKPKFIFYATYLSEKIGYARYITIYRHLERIRSCAFHPIFKWFGSGATTSSATARPSRC
jgi:magnesium-protoporphyrin IX monomethyl ester (oxidative) cyclase